MLGLGPAVSARKGTRGLCLPPNELRGDGDPAAAAAGPDVGVAPTPWAAVGIRERCRGMHDGGIAEKADVHIVDREAVRGSRLRRVDQELLTVDERSVRKGAKKILSKDLVEPFDVRCPDRLDVVVVQLMERREVISRRC